MPELAEIEVIRRELAPLLLGATLRLVEVGAHDMRARGRGGRGDGAGGRGGGGGGGRVGRKSHARRDNWISAASALDGAVVGALHRHGKQLAIEARDGRVLLVQLGMSGQLLWDQADSGNDPHRHLAWRAQPARGKARTLLLRDPRRFGGVTPFASMEQLRTQAWCDLGPDALTLDAIAFAGRLRGIRSMKAVLLDQRVVAGIGNIYADESLFAAGIAPTRRARTLRAPETTRLVEAIVAVLVSAVQHRGSTLRDYRAPGGSLGGAQLLHAVYARGGLPCLRCASPLRQRTIAGRTTTWCGTCQPAVHKGAGRASTGGWGDLPIGRTRPVG